MSDHGRPKLSPNPYSRQPIKNREQLAGRGKELRAIKYYFGLTAAGQSPHLALIGQRGIGKTSLLNASEALAAELKLLPVRLDMNEQKVKSSGEFWHDLYVTLILTLARVGCWGGLQGVIYADLFRMMYARQQPTAMDKVVLQAPFAFSCHQGGLETFVCPDALVVHDLKLCIAEMAHKGYVGMVLLIDEADCLGHNVPLLQMFRNIFQVVDRCSLILAGTESVFPTISEVFSPVPRQFHRIDVKPFTEWPDTRQLVLNPLSREDVEAMGPSHRVIQDLHELCGGDPSEVQLYCHHMYRIVEEGGSPRMSLAPKVFREVLHEYRSSAPAIYEAVINAIERLPDKYLFESRWLSRRNLSLDENVRIEVLRKELQTDSPCSPDDRSRVASELKDGYAALMKAGIIEDESFIHLRGAPLTAGYWKSFVEVEKGKRWTWNEDSFVEALRGSLMVAIGKAAGVAAHMILESGEVASHVLESLRKDEHLESPPEGFAELVVAVLLAKEEERDVSAAVDVGLHMESSAGRHTFLCRFLEYRDAPIQRQAIEEWIVSHQGLLFGNEITLSMQTFSRWTLPSSEEFSRLTRIAGFPLFDKLFGPREIDVAIEAFGNGDIEQCANILGRMLKDKEDPQIGNNLGFCQILLGRVDSGLVNCEKAMVKDYDPLFELNKGVAQFLLGDQSAARQSLSHALEWIRDPANKYNSSHAIYILLLDKTSKGVGYLAGMPIDTAILINLWFVGGISREVLQQQLAEVYPEKHTSWLPIIGDREKQ